MRASSNKKSGSVSLRDIAEAAGVSRMTASRSFKEGTQVRPELRAKVLAAATKMGYKPDQMVSQIMGSFAGHRNIDYRETIAVLWWPGRWASANLQEENYDTKILRGLEASASLHGCGIEHICMTQEKPAHVIDRMLDARNIQSIIITPPQNFDQKAPNIDWGKFCVVSIGATLHKPRFHRSRMSHYNSMVMALEKLQSYGCKRPCLLVKHDLEQRMDRAYTGAFLAWDGCSEKMIWRQDTLSTRGLKSWIKAHKPDAVIADVADWQKYLPEPYASQRFVALNVLNETSDVSGIYQHTELLAEYAVNLLMHVRRRKETGIPKFPSTSVCDGIWVDGKSFQKPAPPSSK